MTRQGKIALPFLLCARHGQVTWGLKTLQARQRELLADGRDVRRAGRKKKKTPGLFEDLSAGHYPKQASPIFFFGFGPYDLRITASIYSSNG